MFSAVRVSEKAARMRLVCECVLLEQKRRERHVVLLIISASENTYLHCNPTSFFANYRQLILPLSG